MTKIIHKSKMRYDLSYLKVKKKKKNKQKINITMLKN